MRTSYEASRHVQGDVADILALAPFRRMFLDFLIKKITIVEFRFNLDIGMPASLATRDTDCEAVDPRISEPAEYRTSSRTTHSP